MWINTITHVPLCGIGSSNDVVFSKVVLGSEVVLEPGGKIWNKDGGPSK